MSSFLPKYTHNHIAYSESIRNVDAMLSSFGRERNDLMEQMITDPFTIIGKIWTSQSPIMIDKKCLFQMGTKFEKNIIKRIDTNPLISPLIRKIYKCMGCQTMTRLLNPERQDINMPFTIESGRFMGKILHIKQISFPSLFLSLYKIPSKYLNLILRQNQITKICHQASIPDNYRALEPLNEHIQTPSNDNSNNVVIDTPFDNRLDETIDNKLNDMEDMTNSLVIRDDSDIVSIKNMYYLGLDIFTNNILITWYIDYLFTLNGMSNINRIYTGFVCSQHGYILSEYPDIGTLREFSEYKRFTRVIEKPSVQSSSYLRMEDNPVTVFTSDTIINCIKQLFISLHLLSDYNFSYGGVDSNSLVFYSERSIYQYQDINVRSDFTLKLNELQSSGINMKSKIDQSNDTDFKIRLYHPSAIHELKIEEIPFKPLVELLPLLSVDDIDNPNIKQSTTCPPKFCPNDSSSSDISNSSNNYNNSKDSNNYNSLNNSISSSNGQTLYPFFKINNVKNYDFFLYVQQIGVPLFQSSFDAYSFMMLLMSNKTFSGGVYEDEVLFELWKSMWLPREFNDVNLEFRQFHQKDFVTKVDIVKFLSKYHLRCDVISLILESIKHLNL